MSCDDNDRSEGLQEKRRKWDKYNQNEHFMFVCGVLMKVLLHCTYLGASFIKNNLHV